MGYFPNPFKSLLGGTLFLSITKPQLGSVRSVLVLIFQRYQTHSGEPKSCRKEF